MACAGGAAGGSLAMPLAKRQRLEDASQQELKK